MKECHLFFEGGDNTGKSTAIKLFIKETPNVPWQVFHFTKPRDYMDAKRQYREFIQNVLPNNPFTICDRFLWGEAVYGPLYRNYDPSYIAQFEEKIKEISKNSFFILCDPDEAFVQGHWDGVELNGGERDDIGVIRILFRRLHDKTLLHRVAVTPDKQHGRVGAKLKNDINRILKFKGERL